MLIEAVKEQQQQINELKKLVEIKNTELEKTNSSNEQINALIEENRKLKEDIDKIMQLLQSNQTNEKNIN